MTIRYFADTDTLHIEIRVAPVSSTRPLDDHTMVDVDGEGRVCALTIVGASVRGTPRFLYEQVDRDRTDKTAA